MLFYYRFPHGGPASHDVQRRDIDDIRYDREDPCTGIKQILTGFTKWTLRYISQCSGQRNNSYQVRRMAKWHKTLNAGRVKNWNHYSLSDKTTFSSIFTLQKLWNVANFLLRQQSLSNLVGSSELLMLTVTKSVMVAVSDM